MTILTSAKNMTLNFIILFIELHLRNPKSLSPFHVHIIVWYLKRRLKSVWSKEIKEKIKIRQLVWPKIKWGWPSPLQRLLPCWPGLWCGPRVSASECWMLSDICLLSCRGCVERGWWTQSELRNGPPTKSPIVKNIINMIWCW